MSKILIIDDDKSIRDTLSIFLSEFDYKVLSAESGEEGLEIFNKERPELVLCDLKLQKLNGLDLLQILNEYDSRVPVIIMTAYGDSRTTIKAIQLGAYDYIEKPLDVDRLNVLMKRALEEKKISEHLEITISKDSDEYKLENSLISKTHVMQEVLKKIGKVSSNRVSVLLHGESGTGKELITKVIHYSGITRHSPFIAVNCTALSETLLESELFGHEKGSFTGAIKDKKGKFELAGEGTIFLDEISEISPNLQVKLLRVLQEKEFERVGGETIIPMQARIIAATNRNLGELVKQGRFREDLYYRLKVFTIEVPPLRERKNDIPALVINILKKINNELHKNVRKIPIEVMEMLQNYEWIGNVRELENILYQAVVLSADDVLKKDNILLRNFIPAESTNLDGDLSLSEMEKIHIEHILKKVNFNKTKACSILKISKPTLDSKIRKYGIK